MIGQRESDTTRAWVEVDLGALARNGARMARQAGVPILPMVKADAYGLGAVPVVGALDALDPWGYGVATVPEGEELREAGVRRRIVIFTPLLPADFARARDSMLTPVLGTPEAIGAWTSAGERAPWHLGVDTGMSRAGIRWDRVGDVADLARADPPEAACTHFHSVELDDGSAAVQEQRFAEAVAALPARPALLHAENSAAISRRPRSNWSLARPGVFLYGVGTGAGEPDPVVAMRARIVEVRDVAVGEGVSYGATSRAARPRRVATAALGYADGYRRILGNRAHALVAAEPAPVAGVVTMDMTMLDVTDIRARAGDVATFIGRDGDALLTVADVAKAGDLSPYELLTGLRGRLPRRYEDA